MSNLGPFNVTPIIERLREQVPALKLVGGAADRVAVEQSATLTTPAAFVILAAEDIQTTKASGLMVHGVRARIDVIYQIRHYRDGSRGFAHTDALESVVAAGRAALNNWRPTGPEGATVELMTGAGRAQLLALRERDQWWLDPFEVEYRSRVR